MDKTILLNFNGAPIIYYHLITQYSSEEELFVTTAKEFRSSFNSECFY